MSRLAFLLVAVLALAACGSSHSSTEGPREAYTQFFSSKTSVSDKVKLLQNGPRFRTLITSFASNPLAKNVTATVSSVTLHGANKAKVVYVIKFAGSALPTQTGIAVRENGTWKVGDASICKLVALQGSTPSVCKS